MNSNSHEWGFHGIGCERKEATTDHTDGTDEASRLRTSVYSVVTPCQPR